MIFLENNNLTRFDSNFKPILEKMLAVTDKFNPFVVIDLDQSINTFINLNYSRKSFHTNFLVFKDKIDCESDHCHLSWLIRDNRDLMAIVSSAQCSNGTKFEDLHQHAYVNCPVNRLIQMMLFKIVN